MAQIVKNSPAMQEAWVRALDREDPLEKRIVTHSSILAWGIPWSEESVGYSPWGHQESDMAKKTSLLYAKGEPAPLGRALSSAVFCHQTEAGPKPEHRCPSLYAMWLV